MWELKPSGFIEVNVTEEMAAEAKARNEAFFKRFGHAGTHRTNKERQRITGYLAESAVKQEFPYLQYSEDHKVDFVFDDKTFDAKAQGCNGEPAPHFSATLYEEQASREVDFLIFCRVQNDFKKVWICGFANKSTFLKESKYCPVGTKTNNFTYDQARYEIEYKKLTSPKKFLKQ